MATSRPSAPRHFRNCRFPAPNRFARGRSVGKHIATSEDLLLRGEAWIFDQRQAAPGQSPRRRSRPDGLATEQETW